MSDCGATVEHAVRACPLRKGGGGRHQERGRDRSACGRRQAWPSVGSGCAQALALALEACSSSSASQPAAQPVEFADRCPGPRSRPGRSRSAGRSLGVLRSSPPPSWLHRCCKPVLQFNKVSANDRLQRWPGSQRTRRRRGTCPVAINQGTFCHHSGAVLQRTRAHIRAWDGLSVDFVISQGARHCHLAELSPTPSHAR